MATKQFNFCDRCGRQITAVAQKEGVTITLGFSRGGWGHRENYVDWDGEICTPCWREYEELAGTVKRWVRKGRPLSKPEEQAI